MRLPQKYFGDVFRKLDGFREYGMETALDCIEVCGGLFTACDGVSCACARLNDVESTKAFPVPMAYFLRDVEIEYDADSITVNGVRFCDYRASLWERFKILESETPRPFAPRIILGKAKTPCVCVASNGVKIFDAASGCPIPPETYNARTVKSALAFVGDGATYRLVRIEKGFAGMIETKARRVLLTPVISR